MEYYYSTRKNFWNNYLLNTYINVPQKCPHSEAFKVYIKDGNLIFNQIIGRCSGCKKMINLFT